MAIVVGTGSYGIAGTFVARGKLPSPGRDGEGTAAQALSTLRLRAITGSKSPEGFTPLDSIAELIEIAPSTAMHMLDRLLLTEPDTEDPHVHPLPHRANMNYKHRAQGIGWSATIFDLPNLSVQTTYQPDCNMDRNLGGAEVQVSGEHPK
eukprot:Skav213796  [mRNA]  locus=scaffold1987:167430:171829:- [translate_table: standard]